MDKMLHSLSKGIASLTLLAFFAPAQASYSHFASSPGLGGMYGESKVPVVGTVVYENDAGSPYVSGLSRVEFASSPVPYILATAESESPNSVRTNSAYGEMRYTFEVLAQPLQTVPVTFNGLFDFTVNKARSGGGHYVYFSVQSATGNAGMNALFGYGTTEVTTGSTGGSIDATWAGSATHSAGSFFGGLPLTTDAQGRATATVVLEAQAFAQSIYGYGLSTAYIDPRFAIDAYWLALNPGATLAITPGVGNEISPVPEPEAYLMFGIGIAVAAIRSRKRPKK